MPRKRSAPTDPSSSTKCGPVPPVMQSRLTCVARLSIGGSVLPQYNIMRLHRLDAPQHLDLSQGGTVRQHTARLETNAVNACSSATVHFPRAHNVVVTASIVLRGVHLLISQVIWVHRQRLLHCNHGQHLSQVVLQHIPQDTKRVEVAATALCPEILLKMCGSTAHGHTK